MKIIFLVRSLTYGGAQQQLVILAKGLQEMGHSVQVITFYPGGVLEKNLERNSIHVRTLDKQGRWDVIGFFARLVNNCR